jgi:Xaa-Pro aminopeptidase
VSDAATRAQLLASLRGAMDRAEVELVALAPTDNLRYVLGFAPLADERACMLLVTGEGAAMLMPALNAEQASAAAPELALTVWSDDEGPAGALADAIAAVGAGGARRGAVDPEMRADHLLLLQQLIPGAALESATAVVGPLRAVKSGRELAALATAASAGDEAVRAALAACKAGATELEVAESAVASFRRSQAEALFTLVAGGPNGAYPHHHTGSRRLEPGDAVVIDLGARLDGYVTDITRMAFIGRPTARYLEVHGVVERAVEAGLAAARPGATCDEVDAAARAVITEAGFGEFFVHRTGHGLGLSVHEPPWIMRGAEVELEPGMVHSIEPGIYLPGEFGVRLEEIVRVTATGCERFSSLPRDVHVVEEPGRGEVSG